LALATDNGSLNQNPRILTVEEDPVSSALLRQVLEHRGFVVDQASTWHEALELQSRLGHRIVIMDWTVGDSDAGDVCRRLRQNAGGYVYLIVLSAKGTRSNRMLAYEAGVDDFLGKPLDREALVARLKVAFRIIRTEDNLQLEKTESERAGEKLRIANNNLKTASRRFEELFHGLPVACFTFDCNGLIHEWNRAAETLFAVEAHLAFQQDVRRTLAPAKKGIWNEEMVSEVFEGKSFEALEWVYRPRNGERRYVVSNIFPLKGPTGEIAGAISANLDITERKLAERQIQEQKKALEEANARLERLADTDGLTGLLNHRRFQEEMEKSHNGHLTSGNQYSLILLDVDHFKSFNDTFGHPAGDAVLKQVASILAGASQDEEIVARYGGEEFAIILPHRDMGEATKAAERYRRAISDHSWEHRKVTASLGVATAQTTHDEPKMLIELADAALYASKQMGRNRVTHADKMDPGSFIRAVPADGDRRAA
jgi:two-component system, cell cycle response regulator